MVWRLRWFWTGFNAPHWLASRDRWRKAEPAPRHIKRRPAKVFKGPGDSPDCSPRLGELPCSAVVSVARAGAVMVAEPAGARNLWCSSRGRLGAELRRSVANGWC